MSTIDNYISGITDSRDVKSYGDKSLDQNDFLKLLSAQLQHQDPMKPMENGEFIAEMAQFSALENSKDLNAAFKDLNSSIISSGSLQASLLVGKSVSYESSDLKLTSDSANISAKSNVAGKFRIQISDSTGNIVSESIVTSASGDISENWDASKHNIGDSFRVSITNTETLEEIIPRVTDKVKSVDVSGVDIVIKLQNGSQIGRNDLIEILEK